MVVDAILIGGAIGASGFIYGYKQWQLLIHERQVSAGLETVVEAKNLRIAELERQMAEDAAKRRRIAALGGAARGRQQRAEKAERRANTISAVTSAPLRPRDEVVAGAREQRRSGNPDGPGTALL